MKYTVENGQCIAFWDPAYNTPNSIHKDSFPSYSYKKNIPCTFSLKWARLILKEHKRLFISTNYHILKKD